MPHKKPAGYWYRDGYAPPAGRNSHAGTDRRKRRERRRRRRRSWGGILIVFLCFAAVAVLVGHAAVFVSMREAGQPETDWSRVIAYVPLDDRIDNYEDVVYLAEASGWRLILPERDLFRTALDGQTPNANGSAYGNREALFEWVRELDAQGCNRFILSLDQLFSGGLVNSRAVSTPQTFTFSDGTVLDETGAFAAYILPLADDPENRVWLFDSILRLSPTVGYQGTGVEEYNALRAYCSVPRPEFSGDTLTLENIFAAYPRTADGLSALDSPICEEYREVLTPELIENYLAVRRRKLTLLDHVITSLADLPSGRIRLLVGADDSSNTPNIQYNELRYIEQRIGPDAPPVMAGLDSLARLLIGRMAQEETGYRVKTAVCWFGGAQDQPSSEYDLYTLREVVELHLSFFHAERVLPSEAELQIFVLTAPADPAQKEACMEQLLSALEYNQRRHIPTILDEASNNAYGDALTENLLERVQFAGLVGFAGKYDQANVTGAAFAMGFSRYLYLRERDTGTLSGNPDARNTAAFLENIRSFVDNVLNENSAPDDSDDETDSIPDADTAQVKQMANSMALTAYILHTRSALDHYIRACGLDRNNISPENMNRYGIEAELEQLFRPECDAVCKNLSGSGLLTGISPRRVITVDHVAVADPCLPWNRTFELSFTIEAALADNGQEESG